MSCIMITLSCSLISTNKYLVTHGRFPHPIALVTCQMLTGSVLAGLTRVFFPSLFPTWDREMTRIQDTLLRLAPLAFCTAGTYVLANLAVISISLGLAQMCKSLNVVIVYLLSIPFGLMTFKWRVALVYNHNIF